MGINVITATNSISSEEYVNIIRVLPSVITYDLTKYYKNASRSIFKLLDNQGRSVGGGVSATKTSMVYSTPDNPTLQVISI